jgi:hypothetical protein
MRDEQGYEETVQVLRLRGAPIIHDTIDNETIAINQQTGRYYSLEGPAAEAWQELQSGTTAATLSERLADHYDVDPNLVRGQVDSFLGELLGEGLIVEDGASSVGDATDRDANVSADMAEPAGRAPFSGLLLHRYTDMEVLLLADPIHDVDETGWPSPQQDATA